MGQLRFSIGAERAAAECYEPVVGEEAEAPETNDLKKYLIGGEVARVRRFFEKNPSAHAVVRSERWIRENVGYDRSYLTYGYSTSVEEYVEKIYAIKEPLITKFGGWWTHLPGDEVQESEVTPQELEEVTVKAVEWFAKKFAETGLEISTEVRGEGPWPKIHRSYADGWVDHPHYVNDYFWHPATGSAVRKHANTPYSNHRLADEAFIKKLGEVKERKLVPYPALNYEIFKYRVYEGLRAAKMDTKIHYAASMIVNIVAGQAVSKSVLRQVKKDFANVPEYITLWERIFELLGEYWSRRNIVSPTLSCAPSTFLKLGFFKDGSSCFKVGNCNEHHKLMLANAPATVVGLYYNDGKEKFQLSPLHPRGGSVAGRSWGVLADGAAHFSNAYALGWPVLVHPTKQVLKALWGAEVKHEASKNDNFPLGGQVKTLPAGIYTNGDINHFLREDIKGWKDAYPLFQQACAEKTYCYYCDAEVTTRGWVMWPPIREPRHPCCADCEARKRAKKGVVQTLI